MAKFYDRDNKVTRLTDGTSLNPLTFERDSGKWIYCNFPEELHQDSLGDRDKGNHYLNHVTVNGPAQVFASHTNKTRYDIYFGIQLYNAGSRSVTVTRENNGFRYSIGKQNWAEIEGGVWISFFDNPDGTKFTINPGKVAWIFTSTKIPEGSFFNAIVRFRTTGTLHCFPYVYRNRNAIDGTADCYPWTSGDRQYRGEGNSYFIKTSLNLKTSQMPYKYQTCSCRSGNTNEMISIYDPCANQWRACSSSDNNIGNWCVQYLFNITVLNDTNARRTIKSYIGPGGDSPLVIPVINFYGTVKWSDPRHNTKYNQWWNWLEDSIPANTSKTYRYQFIHAANGYSPVLHGWRLA